MILPPMFTLVATRYQPIPPPMPTGPDGFATPPEPVDPDRPQPRPGDTVDTSASTVGPPVRRWSGGTVYKADINYVHWRSYDTECNGVIKSIFFDANFGCNEVPIYSERSTVVFRRDNIRPNADSPDDRILVRATLNVAPYGSGNTQFGADGQRRKCMVYHYADDGMRRLAMQKKIDWFQFDDYSATCPGAIGVWAPMLELRRTGRSSGYNNLALSLVSFGNGTTYGINGAIELIVY